MAKTKTALKNVENGTIALTKLLAQVERAAQAAQAAVAAAKVMEEEEEEAEAAR